MTEYTEYKMTANDFEALKTTGIKVTFVKKSGEIRVMRCTTNLDHIPAECHPHNVRQIVSAHMHRVFDLDKSAWRTFNDQTVTECTSL